MMESINDWDANNSQYLQSALRWLRLSMERMAASLESSKLRQERRKWYQFWARNPEVDVAGHPGIRDEEITKAAECMSEAEKADPPPALALLERSFGLSRFEKSILLLCAAMELDTRIAGLCARAQGNPGRPYPTFALALALFEEPVWEALSPEHPLRYWWLVEINQPAAQPLTTSALRADERIVNYIKGLNYLDDRLGPYLTLLNPAGPVEELPPSQQAAALQVLHDLEIVSPARALPVVQLLGADTVSKELVTRHAATALGTHLYRLQAVEIPTQNGDIELLARLWGRESILQPVTLYIDAHEVDAVAPGEGAGMALRRFLSRRLGLTFLSLRESWSTGLHSEDITLDIERPTPAEQLSTWQAALGERAGEAPDRLAGQFNLNLPAIGEIARKAQANSPLEQPEFEARLWDACKLRTRPRLEQLAQRLDAKAKWLDLVLPEVETSLLHQIAGQVGRRMLVYDQWGFREKMTRGLGISVLFAGESGTGKTMATEVLANDLQLDLYRIDLSAVVSKYIGETEKNLRRLFDAAEGGGALLLFDEADALFGKRSEVKDSHDRYANIEINYLLQRMEAYEGLAILATNMKSALDQAFLRRLRFIVNFTFPGPKERLRIWRGIFPPGVPLEDEDPSGIVDYDWLARFNLTGGSIHNAALNAAFMAAADGGRVTMPLVLQAVRVEFRKMDKPINEADFRWVPKVSAGEFQ